MVNMLEFEMQLMDLCCPEMPTSKEPQSRECFAFLTGTVLAPRAQYFMQGPRTKETHATDVSFDASWLQTRPVLSTRASFASVGVFRRFGSRSSYHGWRPR